MCRAKCVELPEGVQLQPWQHEGLLDAMQPLKWFQHVESGVSVSCDTQLNSRTLFAKAAALLSSPFFGFCFLVVLQPSSAEISTLRRIYNPIQTYGIDIREDVNTHKAIWCKYLSRSIYTAD